MIADPRRRHPASHQADAIPGPETDHLPAQPVQRGRQAGFLRQAARRLRDPPGEPVQHGAHRNGRHDRRGSDQEDAPNHRSAFSAPIPRPTYEPTCSARRVNSVGIRNLVDGLAPSDLRASRYCSVIVFSSIPFAAP